MEDEWSDDEDMELAALATLVLVGADESRLRRAARRHDHRRYLCRSDLLPDPRENTPWQALYESQSDRAFITTMGVDCETFKLILLRGFAFEWDTNAIPRHDINPNGQPRLGRRSLTSEGALGLILHYLSSAMSEIALQQIFALVPSTASRYIRFALDILLQTLRVMPEAKVQWPAHSQMDENTLLILKRHSLLRGAFGSIDGLNLPTGSSDDPDIENATFNGWLHDHFVSSVLVFSPRGKWRSFS